ncbi:MFS transporter [Streptosporangium sp. NPDC051022]|uniref:MFS transporter n=1 Tax=Streptosporangium sp. NPDC051022 TaxID=3155752 RepID=UPI003435977F
MSDTTPDAPPVRAGRREWIGLAALALPTLVVSLDIGALYLALPSLSADLGTSGVQQLWITDIYGFLMAGFLITMGNLGDRIGRRRLLLIGAALFGVLSVVAAYSTSPAMLITARALLGIAGATLMPSTLALISNMFLDARQRGTAIAAWVSCMMLGAALGPVVGGLLLAHFWWGSAFLVGVPVVLLLVLAGPFLLPEYRNPAAGPIDLVSVALSLVTILPIIYGLKELAADQIASPVVPIVAIAIGIVAGTLFTRRQKSLAHPLLDLRLLGNGSFSAILASLMFAAASMAGTFLLISQYVQSVLGLTPTEAGLWLLPIGVAIAIGSQLAPMLVKKMSQRTAIVGGLVVGIVGYLLITQVHTVGGLALVVLGGVLVHVGAGPLFALGAYLVVGSVPPERAGAAASMSETSNSFGSTLGLALLGTVGTAVYRFTMADVPVPGVSPAAAENAHSSIAGAAATAHDMPAAAAEELLRVARDAYTSGLNIAAVVGAVVFLTLAVLISRALRRPATAPEESAVSSPA